MKAVDGVRLVRAREVMQLVGLKKTALWQYVKEGRFPAPVRIGSRAVAWRTSDVQKWIESRQSARPNFEEPERVPARKAPATEQRRRKAACSESGTAATGGTE